MMNVIALAFLVSYFGTMVVLVPEPVLVPELANNPPYAPSAFFRPAKLPAQNAVCDQEPCPTSADQVKDTIHQGYQKTAAGLESAKDSATDTVKGAYQQAKHGVQDKAARTKQGVQDKAGQVEQGAQHATQGVQDKAEQVKESAYETAQQAKEGIEDKAGQVKHGVEETARKVASHIPSLEDVKESTYETGEKIATYMPSKEEAISFIPGTQTGKEAADALKQKAGETKDRIASYYEEDSGPASYGTNSLDSLRRKLEDAQLQLSSYLHGRENDPAYLSFANMKKTLDEASSYITSKEAAAASYIPGKDSIEGIKKGVQETTRGIQDKAQDVGESVSNVAQETARGAQDKARDVGRWMSPGEEAASGGHKGKSGGVFHGMMGKLRGREGGRDRGRQLERKVHDLCSLYDAGAETRKGVGNAAMLDVVATRESYGYLMDSAVGSIEKAHEVFERAAEEETGGEWREKYAYLADSAKGALAAAKEVFERAASAAGGDISAPQRSPSFSKASNMTRLKVAAIHTKQRLAATLRPLMRMVYLTTFSFVYGMTVWMTFLSGHLLGRCLPRQQLGVVQSKLFPTYLWLVSICVGLCGIAHAVLHPWPSAEKSEHWQYANLAVCVGFSLLNLLVVKPRVTKTMIEKLKFEKEEGRGQTGEEEEDEAVKKQRTFIEVKLKTLHQTASFLNVAIVAALTWHLWYLANRVVI